MRQSILFLAILCLLTSSIFAATPLKPERATIKDVVPTPVQQPNGNRLDLLFESFEDAVPPAGWSYMTTGQSSTWEQSTSEANSGAASAVVYYGAQGTWQDEWLVTPALDASALAGMFLEFFEAEAYWADWGYVHSIMVSTTIPDDPAAFTSVISWTPADHGVAGWGVPVSVNLSAFAGNSTVYVAFRYEGEYADDWFIDDVWIYEPSDHDVRAAAIYPDGMILLAGEPVIPVFTVANIGVNTETFPVNLTIAEGDMVFYDETITVADLPSGDSIDVEFPPFTPESGNLYSLVGTTMLDGDEEPGNDVIEVTNDCFSAPRTPLALLVTNWDCGPCAPANQVLDGWYPGENGQSALIRVHGWWPGPADPMYLANTEQSDYLINGTPPGADYAPHLWVDNYIDAGSNGPTMPDFINAAKDVAAPLLVSAQYDQSGSVALVDVDVLDPLNPEGDYVLYVAITEDNIYAAGSNGETNHNQAFRWLYPGIEGVPIVTAQGLNTYNVDLPLDLLWVYEELSLVAYVQNLADGKVQNSFTMKLDEGTVAIDPPEEPGDTPELATKLLGAYPNPFNPLTSVKFSLDRAQHVRLDVYDVEGRRVSQIANGVFIAGEHSVRWTGQDDTGRDLPSGTYMVQMVTENAVRTSKLTLVR